MRYLKIGGLALLVIVLAGLAFVIVSDRMAQPAAPDPASLIAKAAQYHVHHRQRDNFGVPHVVRSSAMWMSPSGSPLRIRKTISRPSRMWRLRRAGSLLRRKGLKAAPTDYVVHLMRVWETLDARYEKDLPADVRRSRKPMPMA